MKQLLLIFPLSLHSQTALPKGEPLSDFKPEFDPRNYTLIKINVVQTYNKALLPGELAAQTPERSLTLNLLFSLNLHLPQKPF